MAAVAADRGEVETSRRSTVDGRPRERATRASFASRASRAGMPATPRGDIACAASFECAALETSATGPLYCASVTRADDEGDGTGLDAGVTSPESDDGSRGACWGCETCAAYGDEISWSCPAACDASSSSANVTEAIFLADFDYWNSVLELAKMRAGVVSSGCERSARALTTLTTPRKMSGSGRCASSRGYTARDESRWCDTTALTRTAPYGRCVASPHTRYCGTEVQTFCVAASYFDCCPIEPMPLALTATAAAVALLSVMFFCLRGVYKRKLRKLNAATDALRFVYKLKQAQKQARASREDA